MKLSCQRPAMSFFAIVTLVALFNTHPVSAGSYWSVYNETSSPAESGCLVTEGTAVAESCCTSAEQINQHADLQGDDTCFVLFPGAIPFSGCVGDGIAGYGENCAGEGAPFVAKDAEECGCTFTIEGSGCYKANDLPGQQWFVFLDGDECDLPGSSSGALSKTIWLGLIGLCGAIF